MTEEQELFIALLVIKVGGRTSNTYGLCTFIDRRFDIFDCAKVIQGLIANGYVTYNEIEGGKLFHVSKLGDFILESKRLEIIELLKIDFPREVYLLDVIR